MEQGVQAGSQQVRTGAVPDDEDTVRALGHAAMQAPDDPRVSRDLAQGLCGLRLHKFGLLQFDHAVALAPDDPMTYVGRGRALAQLGELDSALADLRRAVALAPGLPAAHAELGSILSRLGNLDEAMRSLDAAIRLDPGHARAHETRSVILLADGRFEEGWPEYEWRGRGTRKSDSGTLRPWWTGGRGKRLLVNKEQAPGEQILFGALLPELAELTATFTMQLDGRLMRLFERSMPQMQFVDKELELSAGDYDEQISVGSLGAYFRPDIASFSRTKTGYLTPDPVRVRELRARLHAGGKKVCGVSWRSLSFLLADHKSLALDDLVPLIRTPGFDFIDVQYGNTVEERARLLSTHGVHMSKLEDIDPLRDLDGLAALIAACDVVVTSSSTTAHLAGAVGKPTLLLSPCGRQIIWYWVAREGRSLWYPQVRVLTQDRPGDWRKCVTDARAMLEAWPWTD